MKRLAPILILAGILLIVAGVSRAQDDDPLTRPVQFYQIEVLKVIEHDTSAYTQGFLIHDGTLYESTGQRGESTLREVDPTTGKVVRSISVPEPYFAEGLELVGDKLIQLTWQENVAFVYDLDTFEQIGTFEYSGEGWGLCDDGRFLYMSDGTPFLSIRDLETFDLLFQGLVTLQGQPVRNLNELECVGDYVYANVWHTNYILKIDKLNGVVVGVVDASNLLTPEETAKLGPQDVLNGIAYNADTDTFLITGKRWPKMFEVRFVEVNSAGQ